MPAFLAFPDATALAIQALREESINAHSSMPKQRSFPEVLVRRVGGLPRHVRALDDANVQVEVRDTTRAGAYAVAAQCRRILLGLQGRTFDSGDGDKADGSVSAVRDTLGMAEIPDPVDGRDRYIFAVGIIAKGR